MSYNSKHKSSEIEEILDSVEGKQDKLKVVEISTITITDLKSEVVINLTDEQNSLLVYSDTVILMYFMFPYATFGSRCVLHYSLLSLGKSYTGITSRAFSLDKKGDNIFVKAVRDSTTKTLTISFSDIIVTKDSLKTINGTSILGSGDIVISSGAEEVYVGEEEPTNPSIELWVDESIETDDYGNVLDSEMSDYSENAVKNKVIKAYVDTIVGNIGDFFDNVNGEVI